MVALTPIAVQAIAGLIGAGIAGNLIDAAAIRTPPKVLVGLIGGLAGGALAAALAGVGQVPIAAPDPAVTADLSASVDFAALGVWIAGGLIGGGALTSLGGAFGLGR